jgi:hypothetical protein
MEPDFYAEGEDGTRVKFVHRSSVHSTERSGEAVQRPLPSPSGEHTPGPWDCRVGYDVQVWADDERSTVICYVTGSVSNPTAVADGRLIASAPWLLAECQASLRALQDIFDSCTERYDDGQGDHRSIEAHICSLEAAIQKATS